MPLEAPRLDDRTYDELVAEVRTRIPGYLPEWTDWNPSDPGITLLELQAWLTETILHRLNRLPELAFVKFLQLLDVERRPASAARADLTFELVEDLDRPEVLIDAGTVVGVSQEGLEAPVQFETDRTLTAITARLEQLRQVEDVHAAKLQFHDVTLANNAGGQTFRPFDGGPAAGGAEEGAGLMLGFTSSQPFTHEEFALTFHLAETGAPDDGVPGEDETAPRLNWQWWNGIAWEPLDTHDETAGLTQSGQVHIRVPGQIPAVAGHSVGIAPAPPAGDTPPLYYWLRVVLAGGIYVSPPQIERALTNTAGARAARTVRDEAVASGAGTPNQVAALGHRPVLADPPLTLEIDRVTWSEVSDFAASGPEDRHYTLNRATGEIAFGDGRRGRIPPVGQFNIVARAYSFGGGRIGNVGAGTAVDLLTPLPLVDTVTNHRAAEGGEDEEPLADTKVRAPREVLKAGGRAVTLEDFELLARETPGALVARAAAHVDRLAGGERIVRVVIVPRSEADRPLPGEAMLRRVRRHLDQRRLITTRLSVGGPTYQALDVVLDVRARADVNPREVKEVVRARLSEYLHPLRGGEDGGGWPFGAAVAYSRVLRLVMAVEGVDRVVDIGLRKLLNDYHSRGQARLNRAVDLARERAAFGNECCATVEVLDLPPILGSPYRAMTAAVYYCCDMPLAAGALPAVRELEVSVTIDRARSAG